MILSQITKAKYKEQIWLTLIILIQILYLIKIQLLLIIDIINLRVRHDMI